MVPDIQSYGATKMYFYLQVIYWLNGLKRDITEFMTKYPNCQQVKAKNKGPRSFSQDIVIPTWKWEVVNIDFFVGLPRTQWNNDSILVIADWLTESSNLFPSKLLIRQKIMLNCIWMKLWECIDLPCLLFWIVIPNLLLFLEKHSKVGFVPRWNLVAYFSY